MRKLKLIISDLHLGKGHRLPQGGVNPMEDFFHDHRFKELLEYHTSGPYSNSDIELIFNGDILNLIQIDYFGHYTVNITEAVSVQKLRTVIKGHAVFFQALRQFLNHPKRNLTYVIGNHDQEMMWRKARQIFEEAVGHEVNWKNTYYQVDGIHIEHGHQYETVNRVDPTRPFLMENLPEPILNLPWGTLFTMQFIMKLKHQRPYIDKVRPFRLLIWWCLMHDTWAALLHGFHFLSYFISTRFSKSRTRHTSLKLTWRILLEANVFPDLSEAAKRILRTPEIHTVVFGHTHVYKQVQVGEAKQYINTGTWTDITSIDIENFARKSKLTYVRIEYEEDKPLPLLRHWIGRIPLEDDAMAM